MKRKKPKVIVEKGLEPLTISLGGLLLISSWCAYRVNHHTLSVLNTLSNGESLALVISDRGISADSAKDQDALAEATKGLTAAHTESLVLFVACAIIAIGLFWRVWKSRG